MTPTPLVFPSPQGPTLVDDLQRFGLVEVGRKEGGELPQLRRLFWHPKGVLIETEEGPQPRGRLYASLAVCGPSSDDCSAFLKSFTPDTAFFICPRADGTLRAAARPSFGPEGPWSALAKLQELGHFITAKDDGPAGWRHTAEEGGFCFERHSGTRTTWTRAAPQFLRGAPNDVGTTDGGIVVMPEQLAWTEVMERHGGFHAYTAPRLSGEPEDSPWRQRVSRWEKSAVPDDAAWRLVQAESFVTPVGPGGLCLPACLLAATRYHRTEELLLPRMGRLLEEAPDAVFRAWAFNPDNQGMTLGLHLMHAVLHNGDAPAPLTRAFRTVAERSAGAAPLYTEQKHVLGLLLDHHIARARNGLPWKREPSTYPLLLGLLDEADRMGLDWGREQPVVWHTHVRTKPWVKAHRVERMTAHALAQAYGPDLLATSPSIQRLCARLQAGDEYAGLSDALPAGEGAVETLKAPRL